MYAMCAWEAPFSYRMEESDDIGNIPDAYSRRLRHCIASCMAYHAEDRYDAIAIRRYIKQLQRDENLAYLAPDMISRPRSRASNQSVDMSEPAIGSFSAGESMPTVERDWRGRPMSSNIQQRQQIDTFLSPAYSNHSSGQV